MRPIRLTLRVTIILIATGALAGFTTSQFLPRRYVSITTAAFPAGVSSDRCTFAAEQTLSAEYLTPLVIESPYYKSELDFTPVEELVERIRANASIQSIKIGTREGFRIRFTDADRYATLEIVQALTEAMERNEGQKTQIVDPVRSQLVYPGPGACVLIGMAGGLLLGMIVRQTLSSALNASGTK